MSALDCVYRILNTKLADKNLKYCFVTTNKLPTTINGTMAKINNPEDFVDIDYLLQDNITNYAGVGISIQASNVCAIDVDGCFKIPNDIDSISDTAKDILNMFKDFAYCEFSFSGKGMRILFRLPLIENYSETYYIKNSDSHVEYYQPSSSYRYVTLTGNVIRDNDIDCDISHQQILYSFLNKYMKKQEVVKVPVQHIEDISKDTAIKKIRFLYLKNYEFQELWFGKAPGSGKDESERDFHILAYLYENITQNKELLKELFEESPYFKTKDSKHINKWEYQNYRYYNYIYEQLRRKVL